MGGVRIRLHSVVRIPENDGIDLKAPVTDAESNDRGVISVDLEPGLYVYSFLDGRRNVVYAPPEISHTKIIRKAGGRSAIAIGRTPVRCSGVIEILSGRETAYLAHVFSRAGIIGQLPLRDGRIPYANLAFFRNHTWGGEDLGRIPIEENGSFKISDVSDGDYYIQGFMMNGDLIDLVFVAVSDYRVGSVYDMGVIGPYSDRIVSISVETRLDDNPIAVDLLKGIIGHETLTALLENAHLVIMDKIPGHPTLRWFPVPLMMEGQTIRGFADLSPYKDIDSDAIKSGTYVGLPPETRRPVTVGGFRLAWRTKKITREHLDLIVDLQRL